MPGLPPLIEEDVKVMDAALAELLRRTEATLALMDAALAELLRRTEATLALVIDKGGPVIQQRGSADQFDTATIGALAAGSFCATQAIAERLGETHFANIYQQGTTFSLLFRNIDDNALLIIIFKAELSAGAIKYYAAETAKLIVAQLQRAQERAPGESIDLVSENVVDVSAIFGKTKN